MSLLEELAKKEELNIDFHNHGQTGDEFRKRPEGLWNKIKYSFFSEGFEDLSGLLQRISDSRLDIMYLTDTVDSKKDNKRFISWTSKEQIEIAKKKDWEIEVGDYYVFAAKGEKGNRKVIALGHSIEMETKDMHMNICGADREKIIEPSKTASLDIALTEVKNNELTIGEKYNPKLDAVQEDGNFYFPFSLRNWFARRAGRKYRTPVVDNEDGHHPKDIGDTYNIIKKENLKYFSGKYLRDSIKRAILDKKFSKKFRPVPPYRIFHHVMMMGLNMIKDYYRNSTKRN